MYTVYIGNEVAGRVDTLVEVYKILKLIQSVCLYYQITPLIKLMKFKNSSDLTFISCWLLFEVSDSLYIRNLRVVKDVNPVEDAYGL